MGVIIYKTGDKTMACRVGITTNLARRQSEYERDYPNLYNWTILGSGLTKEQAQEIENREKAKGYEASGSGRDADGSWSVYRFRY